LENIDYCVQHKIKVVVFSINIKNAFDTVDQDYFSKVFEFFNFGPRPQKWLKGIGTDRNARILFEDGSRSDLIKLLCWNRPGIRQSVPDFIQPGCADFGFPAGA
jgi:hypothetical protein